MKPPKRPTARRVHNRLRAYLDRYTAPRAHIARTLMRRLDRDRQAHPDVAREDIVQWVDAALDEAERAGLINDRAWAFSRARSLARKGTSERGIRAKLREKSTPRELIDSALDSLRENEFDTERVAAANLIRKRRLGPFRPLHRRHEDDPRKDLARLARAGFRFDLARELLAESEETLRELGELRRRL